MRQGRKVEGTWSLPLCMQIMPKWQTNQRWTRHTWWQWWWWWWPSWYGHLYDMDLVQTSIAISRILLSRSSFTIIIIVIMHCTPAMPLCRQNRRKNPEKKIVQFEKNAIAHFIQTNIHIYSNKIHWAQFITHSKMKRNGSRHSNNNNIKYPAEHRAHQVP